MPNFSDDEGRRFSPADERRAQGFTDGRVEGAKITLEFALNRALKQAAYGNLPLEREEIARVVERILRAHGFMARVTL